MRKKRRRLWRRILPAFCVIALALALTAEIRLRPLLREYAVNQAQRLAEDAMAAAVDAVLVQTDAGQLTAITRDTGGAVLSVQTDAAAVNRLSAQVVHTLHELLLQERFCTVAFPLFDALGSSLLMNHGPRMTVRLAQNGSVTTDIAGSFAQAGINQTVYRLELTVTFRVLVMTAGLSDPVEVSDHFLLVETVIVGAVPDVYATRNEEKEWDADGF